MNNHPLALDQETIRLETPQTIVTLAAEFGFQGVCLRLVRGRTDNFPILGDTPMRREVHHLTQEYGVNIFSCETVYIGPRFVPEDQREMLETCAYLGVQLASIITVDTDLVRAGDNLAKFAELAAAIGIRPILEGAPLCSIKTPAQALALIEASGANNAGIGLDALHLTRTGTTAADIAALDPAKVLYFQICDGPAVMPHEQLLDEALTGRLVPGEGAFPLLEYVDALPDGVPIGIEVPNSEFAERASPRDRVRFLAGATRDLLGPRLMPPATR